MVGTPWDRRRCYHGIEEGRCSEMVAAVEKSNKVREISFWFSNHVTLKRRNNFETVLTDG